MQASQGRDSHGVDGHSSKCDCVLSQLNLGPGPFQTSPGSTARARSQSQAWRRRCGGPRCGEEASGSGSQEDITLSALTSFRLLPTLTSYLYFRLFHG